MKRFRGVLLLGFLLLIAPVHTYGQLRVPTTGFKNSIGIGGSGGFNLSKDATFVGFAPDYSRALSEHWILNIGAGWDRESEKLEDGTTEVGKSWTGTAALAYSFTRRILGAVGYGREFAKENSSGRMAFTGKGDNSIGLIGAYVLWTRGRHDITATASVERNLTQNETTLSFDIGYAISF
jgi:hypothetical protein